MKRFFMMAMLATIAFVANAKDDRVTFISGNNKAMTESGKTAIVEFDYTQTICEGKPLPEYLAERGEEHVRDWPALALSSKNKFCDKFNSKNKKGVQITDNADADLKITVAITKMHLGSVAGAVLMGGRTGGAEVCGTITVANNKTGETIAQYEIFEVRGGGSYNFTETKRMAATYEAVATMWAKEIK